MMSQRENTDTLDSAARARVRAAVAGHDEPEREHRHSVNMNIISEGLHNIGRIRKYLTAESTKGAVISLVTSRFDYCNGLLCGIPEELICKLQRVQNNAARVITLTKKYDHITPVLKELHWLPVGRELNSRFFSWRTSVCMELHPLT